jgi:hypothetical protein
VVVLLCLIRVAEVRLIQVEVAEVADQQAEEVVAVDLLEHM